jgi:hypothetical protein
MAEGRMIKRRISKSKKFAELKTHNARLLYLMIYPHLDVQGRLDADPKIIKGQVCPLLNFSLSKIKEYLEDMNGAQLINLYEVNGDVFLEYTRFKDFQRLRLDREADSDIPSNPTQLPESRGITPEKRKLKERKFKGSLKKRKERGKLLKKAKEILKTYPKIADERASINSIIRLLSAGKEKDIMLSITNYLNKVRAENIEKRFMIQSNNFFGQHVRWKEHLAVVKIETPAAHKEFKPPEISAEEQARSLEKGKEVVGKVLKGWDKKEKRR